MRCADEYNPATVSKSPAAARMAQSNLSRLRCSGPVWFPEGHASVTMGKAKCAA
jgi:hypothetical protein